MIARMAPAFVFFGLVLVFLVLLTRPDVATAELELRPLPELTLQDHNGAPLTLPKDEWLVVNFFASWCVPCVLEHPQLMALQKQGVKVVGIAYRDTKARTDEFLKNRGNPYVMVANDPQGAAALAFGITGVPETFVVNPLGNIVWHFSGPVMDSQLAEIKDYVDAPH